MHTRSKRSTMSRTWLAGLVAFGVIAAGTQMPTPAKAVDPGGLVQFAPPTAADRAGLTASKPAKPRRPPKLTSNGPAIKPILPAPVPTHQIQLRASSTLNDEPTPSGKP